jgi:hypothetical protein
MLTRGVIELSPTPTRNPVVPGDPAADGPAAAPSAEPRRFAATAAFAESAAAAVDGEADDAPDARGEAGVDNEAAGRGEAGVGVTAGRDGVGFGVGTGPGATATIPPRTSAPTAMPTRRPATIDTRDDMWCRAYQPTPPQRRARRPATAGSSAANGGLIGRRPRPRTTTASIRVPCRPSSIASACA